LIKISSCAHLPTFDLLDKYAEKLIDTAFGHADGAEQEVKDASDKINRAGIHEMLKLETPNLHEIGLDRVIAYGHTYVLYQFQHFLLLLTHMSQLVPSSRADPRGPSPSRTRHLD